MNHDAVGTAQVEVDEQPSELSRPARDRQIAEQLIADATEDGDSA